MTDAISPDRPEPIRSRVALVTSSAEELRRVDDSQPSDVPMTPGVAAREPTAPVPQPTEPRSRLEELEMRLRERDERSRLRDIEFRALERDLAIKEAYIARLEFEQDRLVTEVGQIRDRAAELFGDLEHAEARITELSALAALAGDIQSQASYRLAVRLNHSIERFGRLRSLLSRLAAMSVTQPKT